VWPFALMGLAFPVLAGIMLMLLIIWVVRKRWFALVPLAVLLMGFPQVRNMAAWRLKLPTPPHVSPVIKIMTYNARNFDLYNWSNNIRSKAIIYDMLRKENPDVICFQEFYSDTTHDFNNIRDLREMGYLYYSFAEELTLRKHNQWGIATFSKYPILETQKVLKSRFRTGYGFLPYKGIYTRIKYEGVQFGLYNVHMQSIHFGEQDYEAIKEAAEEQDLSWIEGRTIIGKLVKAYNRRAFQANELAGILKDKKEATIVAGDFNDTPTSYAYHRVRGKLKDAFLEAGRGMGSSYNGKIPALRIDYLLHTEDISALQVRMVDNRISDHRPLVGIFYIPQ
jgi:endonuclease/exonuclease/phosphatase family metal-dependent hydrolase